MIIDLRTGDVSFENKTIHLTKNEILTLAALNKNTSVPMEEIYEKVYMVRPNIMDEYSKKQIYINICRLRKKLKRFVNIKTINGYGCYKLFMK